MSYKTKPYLLILLLIALSFTPACYFFRSKIPITSTPEGAKVFIDDQDTGAVTPAEIQMRHMSLGKHGITVKKKGHVTSSAQNVEIVIDKGRIFATILCAPIVIPMELFFRRMWKDALHQDRSKRVFRDGFTFELEPEIATVPGVVYDKNTGLEWLAGPDRDTEWNDAKSWVENLTVAGGGWRMPTKVELSNLYKKGAGTRNMTPLLKTTGWYVWSGETKASNTAWRFDFHAGYERWGTRSGSRYGRGFAVRSR